MGTSADPPRGSGPAWERLGARPGKVVKEVDARHDLVGSTLATLVLSCHQNGGVLSRHRRKQFGLAVPAAAFDLIEASVRRHLGQRAA